MISPTRTTGYLAVLRHRQFACLALAHAVVLLGMTVASLALAVLIFERTASPLLSSLTFAVSFTPYLLGGALSARFDSVPPRRLMIACDLVQGGGYAVMAVPGLPVPVLLAVLALGSVAAPIFSGARAGLLPALVGDAEGFVLGRSILRLISQSGQIVGLAVGGALLLVVDPHAAVLGVAGSYAGSALLLRLGIGDHRPVLAPDDQQDAPGPVLSDPRRRRLLLLGWVVPMAAVAPEALAVPYVVELGFPAAGAGFLLGAAPAGAVLGEVVTARLPHGPARARSVVPLTVLTLLTPLAFLFRPDLPVAVAVMLVSSAGAGYSLGLDQELMAATPPALQRRMLTVSTAGLMFGQGVGFALAGAAAEVVSPTVVIPAISLAGLVAVALLTGRRSRGCGRRTPVPGMHAARREPEEERGAPLTETEIETSKKPEDRDSNV